MNARQSRRGKRISLQQEKQAAADLGGRVQAGSGAAKFSGGGDVRVMGDTRVECKYTEKDTYTLRFIELQKVRKQAMKALEKPILQFAFHHPSGRMTKYAVIPWVMDGTDKPKDTDHSWFTSKYQIGLTEQALEKALFTGRIQFMFMCPGTDPLPFRTFEIMRWHDYVERTVMAGAKKDA